MNIVVYPDTTSIVVQEISPTISVEASYSNIAIQDTVSNIVSPSTNNTIVSNEAEGSIVVTGIMGPAGASYEDSDMYTKRIDFVGDSVIYKGEAFAGSSESMPVWRIRKITLTEDISETWASGSTSFSFVWADRYTLVYS